MFTTAAEPKPFLAGQWRGFLGCSTCTCGGCGSRHQKKWSEKLTWWLVCTAMTI